MNETNLTDIIRYFNTYLSRSQQLTVTLKVLDTTEQVDVKLNTEGEEFIRRYDNLEHNDKAQLNIMLNFGRQNKLPELIALDSSLDTYTHVLNWLSSIHTTVGTIRLKKLHNDELAKVPASHTTDAGVYFNKVCQLIGQTFDYLDKAFNE